MAEQDKRNAVELAQAKVAGEMQKSAVAKDSEIQELKARLDAAEVARKLAITEALSAVQKERDALANELEQAKRDKLAATELAEAKLAIGLTAQLGRGHASRSVCRKHPLHATAPGLNLACPEKWVRNGRVVGVG